jgi:hypothetical protein
MSDTNKEYIPNGSFEFNGEPSYKYWRMTYPAFVGFSAEAPENGGSWSLAVSSERVFMPIVGAKNGETYRLTALVKRVEHGSPGISLGIGPTFPPKGSGGGMSTSSPNWTWLKTQATVKLEPGDTLWAILSSSASEFGIGLFDRVSLERVEPLPKDSTISTSFYLGHHSYGNGWTEPAPEIGWDSLYARIVYPRLPLMVGFEAIVWTRILIDYDGNVDTIDTHVALAPSVQNVSSESFVEAVKTALRSTKWRIRGHQ